MTPLQLKILHIAKRDRGIDEADWRTILRSIARVQSSKDLTNAGFEDVMAYLEAQGYRQPGKPETYWRSRSGQREREEVTSRQVHMIGALAREAGIGMEGFCRRMSNGQTDQPELLSYQEAYNVIEALKAIIARKATDPLSGTLTLPEPACLVPAEPNPELW
jgi:hypothetical protein